MRWEPEVVWTDGNERLFIGGVQVDPSQTHYFCGSTVPEERNHAKCPGDVGRGFICQCPCHEMTKDWIDVLQLLGEGVNTDGR